MSLFRAAFVAVLFALAQSPPAPRCPAVVVICPDYTGSPLRFTASVTGGDAGVTPTFNWTLSAGAIGGGQGTSSITVDTTGVNGTLTATVDVGGYDRSCRTSASCTTSFHCPPPTSRKVDEYGVVSLGVEKERLNHVYEELRNDPTAQGYLICYGGRRSRAGEAERRCRRAREYLVPTRGIDASRVVLVEGGLREAPATEFWLVPSGAEPPQAAPTVKPRAAAPARTPLAARRRRARR
jgi:hypothetical protein